MCLIFSMYTSANAECLGFFKHSSASDKAPLECHTLIECLTLECLLRVPKSAFDKVPHRFLMQNIKGKLLEWIGDFLSERKQCFVMGTHMFNWESVKSGLPQSTVLCPVLFTIYINDIPDIVLNYPYLLYAGDCKTLAEIKNEVDSQLLQANIDSIVRCPHLNKFLGFHKSDNN